MKFILCTIALSLLVSCGLWKKKPTTPVVTNPNVRLAGIIHSVNNDFVLIRRYGRWHVEAGEVVECRGDTTQASLQPTGEQLGEHIAADIQQGTANVGDAVYIRRITKKAPTQPETKPNKPAAKPDPDKPTPPASSVPSQQTQSPPQS